MNPTALSYATAYDAFKNNDHKTGSLTLTGVVSGNTGPGTGIAQFTTTIVLDREESVTEIYISSNRTSDQFTVGTTYQLIETIDHPDGINSGIAAFYSVLFTVEYPPNAITITAFIPNPYTTTLSNIDEIFDLSIFTFVTPFTP